MKTTWYRVQPIGFVRRPGADIPEPEAFYDPRAETALDILPRWEAALAGIEEYSHLLVIVWLDRVKRVRTPGVFAPEGRLDLPEVGLFATRTPRRPNPLGVSTPRLLRREGRTLWVSGIDAWPDTPIVDVKGYAPRDDLHPEATVPDWLNHLWSIHDTERSRKS
jgi:tRNA-Thr(GGU) m(6)t(6)A37 methyltransferase TsaA